MNHIYKTKFNYSTRAWVAVPEIATGYTHNQTTSSIVVGGKSFGDLIKQFVLKPLVVAVTLIVMSGFHGVSVHAEDPYNQNNVYLDHLGAVDNPENRGGRFSRDEGNKNADNTIGLGNFNGVKKEFGIAIGNYRNSGESGDKIGAYVGGTSGVALGTNSRNYADYAISIGDSAQIDFQQPNNDPGLIDLQNSWSERYSVGSVAIGHSAEVGVIRSYETDSDVANLKNSARNAVAIGSRTRVHGDGAIALGGGDIRPGFDEKNAERQTRGAIAESAGAIAIGGSAYEYQGRVANTGTGYDAGEFLSAATVSANTPFGIAIGSGSQVGNTDGTEVRRAIAIGTGSSVESSLSVALGNQAKVGSGQVINLINPNTGEKDLNSKVSGRSIAIGDNVGVAGTHNVGIGAGVVVGENSRGSVAFGYAASVGKARLNLQERNNYPSNFAAPNSDSLSPVTSATALGTFAAVTQGSDNGTALGSFSMADNKSSIAIGSGYKEDGIGAYTRQNIGAYTGGEGAVAIGSALKGDHSAQALANHSVAIGTGSTVQAQAANTVVIGYRAGGEKGATEDNSVYLGANSDSIGVVGNVSAYNGELQDIRIGEITYKGFAGRTPTGIVTVGNVNAPRRVQAVAAGLIGEQSTDAINGSQLYATNKVIDNLAGSVASVVGAGATVGSDGKIKLPDAGIGGTGKQTIDEAIAAVRNANAGGAGGGFTINSTSDQLIITDKRAEPENSLTFSLNTTEGKADFDTVAAGSAVGAAPDAATAAAEAGKKLATVGAVKEYVDSVKGASEIAYRAGDSDDVKHASISDGFQFKSGSNLTATAGENGEISYALNDELNNLKSISFTGSGASITGLSNRLPTAADYGVDANTGRAATEGAVKATYDYATNALNQATAAKNAADAAAERVLQPITFSADNSTSTTRQLGETLKLTHNNKDGYSGSNLSIQANSNTGSVNFAIREVATEADLQANNNGLVTAEAVRDYVATQIANIQPTVRQQVDETRLNLQGDSGSESIDTVSGGLKVQGAEITTGRNRGHHNINVSVSGEDKTVTSDTGDKTARKGIISVALDEDLKDLRSINFKGSKVTVSRDGLNNGGNVLRGLKSAIGNDTNNGFGASLERALGESPNAAVTVTDLRNVYTNTGWSLVAVDAQGKPVSDPTKDAAEVAQKIGNGNRVTFKAGKNISLSQSDGEITIATESNSGLDIRYVQKDQPQTEVYQHADGEFYTEQDDANPGDKVDAANVLGRASIGDGVTPTQLGNIASTIGGAVPDDLQADTAKDNNTFIQALNDLAAPTDSTQSNPLNHAATVGDIQNLAKTPIFFKGDTGEVSRQLNETLTISGGATDVATGNNIGVVADADTAKLSLQLAKNISGIESIAFDKGANASGVTLSNQGLDLAGHQIANLGEATQNGQAVRYEEYAELKERLDNLDGRIVPGNNGGTAVLPEIKGSGATLVTPIRNADGVMTGYTIDVPELGGYRDQDGNVLVRAQKDDGTYYTDDNGRYRYFKVGDKQGEAHQEPSGVYKLNTGTRDSDITNSPRVAQIYLNNPTADEVVALGNVGDGELSNTSTQAVNGKQVVALADSLGTVLGDGISYDSTTNSFAGSNIGGTGKDTIADAIKAAFDKADAAANGQLTFSGDSGTVSRKAGETLAISGGATEVADGNNIGVVAGNDGLQLKLAKNLTGLESVEFSDAETGKTVRLSSAGLDNGGQVLTGVESSIDGVAGLPDTANYGDKLAEAAKLTPTNAVNVQDLATAIDAIRNSGNASGSAGDLFDANSGTATNPDTPVIGDRARASGAYSLASGSRAQARGEGSIAYGQNAVALTNNSVALGSNAQAGEAHIENTSVNGRTVAGTGETVVGVVSVGRPAANGVPAQQRQIQNVAAGAVAADSTDAVNGSQLFWLGKQVEQVGEHADAGVAAAIAGSNIPQVSIPGKRSIGAAFGNYRGQSALAVGVSALTDNGKWAVKGSANVTKNGAGGGVGLSYQW